VVNVSDWDQAVAAARVAAREQPVRRRTARGLGIRIRSEVVKLESKHDTRRGGVREYRS